MSKWIQAATGIRYRKHPSRKYGAKYDRYYVIRHSPYGVQKDEPVGWASDGWTLMRVQGELSRLLEAKRTGNRPRTLKEEKEANLQAEREKAEAEAALARRKRTVHDLWDRYAKEVMAIENKPRTAAQKTRMWRQRIEPAIGHLKVGDVTEEDVGAVVRAPLRLDASGQVVAGKAAAGDLYRLLHHLFHKALGWRLRAKELGNPLENVSEPKTARRERLLTGGEIGALMRTLDAVEHDMTERPQTVAAIRAAVFTGCRISEVLALRWQDIRLDEMTLRLADTKTGFSERPISADALAIFDSVERMPGVEFVFRAINTPTKPLSYFTVEKAFRRIAGKAGIKGVTLHTIRHWFATMTANAVSNPRVGMALTGHKSHAAYLNYVHAHKDQAHALADQLGQLATGLAKADPNVTALRKSGTDQSQRA